ncbi:MAG: hypothetical protein IKF97_00410 [Clostridia bacterium]|nr:hypothetical protein [Clostridia bacterium]
MFIKEFMEKFEQDNVKMYVDMDGVIADYNVGEACNYDKKRPLYTNISKLEEISKMDNVEMYVLSVTRMSEGIEQKNIWLDEFAPFFKKENRVILSREANDFMPSRMLKSSFLKSLDRDGKRIIVIDDDPSVIKQIAEENQDIVLLKDTALVD